MNDTKDYTMSSESEDEIKELLQQKKSESIETKNNNVEVIKKLSREDASEADFTFARENMMQAILAGQDAVQEMFDIAKQSQHPRAYEVMSLLLKTILEGNKQLIEIQKIKAEAENLGDGPKTVNNNLFVGSTTDLHRFIKQLKKSDG